MFRLTVDGALPAAWRTANPRASATKMRVYKWEDKAGLYLCGKKWEAAWTAEQRVPMAHGPGFLLEQVTPLPMCDAPPPSVDDAWSEDVVIQGNIIAGNSLTIVGNSKAILDFSGRYGVKMPNTVTHELTSAEPPRAELPRAELPAEAAPSTLDTPPTALLPPPASAGPKSLPPRQPPPHLRSSHAPSIHPAPRALRTEELHRPVSVPMRGPRPAHTGPRPYAPPAGQGPTSRDRFHPGSARPRPAPEHGESARHHYGQHRTGRPPHAQGCLVVEE